MKRAWLAALTAWGVGCGVSGPGEPTAQDAGAPPIHDAGAPPQDAGLPTDAGVDAGPADAGFRLPPLFDGGPPLGAAISAPSGAWTWVDFPDSACDDGSTTGIGINPSATRTNVLLYFEGGGACWDYTTCYVLNTATHGPFQKANFDAVASGMGGSIFDRTSTQNPFQDWSYVYIPYCTGDVHTGSNVITYGSGTFSGTYHHMGHANALAYLARLGPTFPAPEKLVVSGSSAGAGGATSNYAYARAYWPRAEMFLLADSLPFFQQGEMPASTPTWIANWGSAAMLDALCGPACVADLSRVYPTLRAAFPVDRMALLSSEQDGTISRYYGMGAAQYEADLNGLATEVLRPANIRTFFVNGSTHTMLYGPGSFSTTSAVGLWSWLTQMTSDDANWVSAGP